MTLSEVTLHSHLIDTLCYFVKAHAQRTKFLLVQENIAAPIAKLLACPEKHLRLMALKFFRSCIGLHDAFYNEQLLKSGVFDGILDIVYETMPRDNLLNSACLELFEFIKRENLKDLTIHLVDRYRDRLKGITYVETFKQLIEKYEKYMNPPLEILSFTSVETEPNRVMIPGGQPWRQQGLKEQDAEEEAYFNGADDEDEARFDGAAAAALKPTHAGINGAGTNRPLVDYPEDEDDGTMDVLAQEPDISPDQPRESTEGSENAAPSIPTPATPESAASKVSSPPESIAEKRKREDDEEDELSKIASQQTKRRSSSVGSVGSTASVASSVGHHHGLRRKSKSIQAAAKDGHGPKQKISIALAVKSGNGGGDGGE
jgi:protein phosphatase-4 regulatory subunit 3